jgi:hypothetical protein
MAEQKPKFRIHDNAAVVETYANKFIGSSFDGGAVMLTFGTTRFIPPEQTDEEPKEGHHSVIHVTTRLALSPSCAIELIKGLNAILSAVTQAQAQAQRDRLPDKAVM